MARRASKSKNAHPFNTDDLIKEAIELLKKEKYIWSFNDLANVMPYHISTLRKHGLDQHEEIDKLITKNKTSARIKKRKDLDKNDNAAAQIAFYKLVAEEKELDKLKLEKEVVKEESKGDNTLKIEIVGGENKS